MFEAAKEFIISDSVSSSELMVTLIDEAVECKKASVSLQKKTFNTKKESARELDEAKQKITLL